MNRNTSPRSHLRISDIFLVGISGLLTRKVRATLSALGITIGIAAVVGVLGLSESGNADLMRELDSLGTNLLTVEAGQSFGQTQAELPKTATSMVKRIGPVYEVASVSRVPGKVLRNEYVDKGRTQGITIFATDLNLLSAQRGEIASGTFLQEATSHFPNVVLGAVAAERLGIRNASGNHRIWLDGQWFSVVGIVKPFPLAADLDRAALIGYGAAEQFIDHEGVPDILYIRAEPEHILDVRSVLAGTVNPENPEEVSVGRASDVLEAKVAASTTFTNLFLGLGAVALIVGGIGIANVMVISVIERRNEIGLRRALGATKTHIAMQFITEALLLSLIGGLTGVAVGALITAIYATIQGWEIVIPALAIYGGIIVALLLGVLAGLYPSLRAASLAPTEALRTT